MKRLLLSLVIVCLAAAPALAGEPGDIGVFADPLGLDSHITALPVTPFDYYVVAFDLDGDIFGYEMMVTQDLTQITVLARTTLPPTALDVGPGPDNWIVGTGVCMPGQGPQALLSMQGLVFTPVVDLTVCLGPADPSTPALGGGPGWLKCDETLQAFGIAQSGGGVYPDGCGIINASDSEFPIGVEDGSWGSVKAQFE